jgi:hypothetical protein
MRYLWYYVFLLVGMAMGWFLCCLMQMAKGWDDEDQDKN